MNHPAIKFPALGTDPKTLQEEISKRKEKDFHWRQGKMLGYVYYSGDENTHVMEECLRSFMFDNTLNPIATASLREMENELIDMMRSLFHGGMKATGSVTSGGTESIFLAMKVARDIKLGKSPEEKPEVVVPVSAHPAFDKAADYLGIKLIRVPLGLDFRVDIIAMEKAITNRTCMLVGSAPSYPHGVMDPIGEIASLALKYHLLCHVDACIGGFMLPFMEKLGYNVPLFDFRLKGVTSISADVHKYRYSVKGASVILYRNPQLRKSQFFVTTDWPGGIYVSSTILGSRSGVPIASAWSMIRLLGCEGYCAIVSEVMQVTKKIQDGIKQINGIRILSNPEMSVFAIQSPDLDIYSIGDEMEKRGWLIDRLQHPASLHVTINRIHNGKEEVFLEDLRQSVVNVSANNNHKFPDRLLSSAVMRLSELIPAKTFKRLTSFSARFVNKSSNVTSRTAPLYGITAKMKNRNNVREIILSIYDRIYRSA
jgi:sphinganine-1-phosphate aldolase